jgi:hypothetical protein
MPLDPLSALGVVASVIQLVEFSTKIISKGQHLYKSPSGTSAENEETAAAAKRLKGLAWGIQESLRTEANVGDYDQAPLEAITDQCLEIADELALELEKLKVPVGAKFRRWKSFRQALKCAWSKEKLENMRRRLMELREDLGTHVIVGIRYVSITRFGHLATEPC